MHPRAIGSGGGGDFPKSLICQEFCQDLNLGPKFSFLPRWNYTEFSLVKIRAFQDRPHRAVVRVK